MPNATDPSGMLKWDQGKNVSGVDAPFPVKAYPIEVYDWIVCMAREGGIFDYQYWTPPMPCPNLPFGPFYSVFEDVVKKANPGIADLNLIYPFTATGEPAYINLPTFLTVSTEQTCDGTGRAIFDIEKIGQLNKGRCKSPRPALPPSSVPVLPPNSPIITNTPTCDRILTPENINSVGVKILGIGAWVGLGGGFSAYVMADPNDFSRFVVIGTLESGVGLEVELDLGTIINQGLNFRNILNAVQLAGASRGVGLEGFVVSEASLDQLTGVSFNANLSFLVHVGASITIPPVGSNECSLVAAEGSLGSIGASLSISASDVIYDSVSGKLFPNGFWNRQ